MAYANKAAERGTHRTGVRRGGSGSVSVRCGDSSRHPGLDPMGAADRSAAERPGAALL